MSTWSLETIIDQQDAEEIRSRNEEQSDGINPPATLFHMVYPLVMFDVSLGEANLNTNNMPVLTLHIWIEPNC